METINDIVAEMRAKTAKSKDEAWYDKDKWAGLCNRIEMAWEREAKAIATENAVLPAVCITVGNAAKMREALVQCELFLGNVSRHGHPTLNPGDKCTACSGADELRGMVARALSAPPRNCDLLNNAQEAITAIHNDRCYTQSPIDERKLTVVWLLKEAKGANNEQ